MVCIKLVNRSIVFNLQRLHSLCALFQCVLRVFGIALRSVLRFSTIPCVILLSSNAVKTPLDENMW